MKTYQHLQPSRVVDKFSRQKLGAILNQQSLDADVIMSLRDSRENQRLDTHIQSGSYNNMALQNSMGY